MRISSIAVLLVFTSPAIAAGMPSHVGQCVATQVLKVETRLMDGSTGQPMPGSGSAIEFVNGGYQVAYDQLAAVDGSRPGDPVTICLVTIPHSCPPGDTRGRTYRTTNLRIHGAWTLPDSEHSCGGA